MKKISVALILMSLGVYGCLVSDFPQPINSITPTPGTGSLNQPTELPRTLKPAESLGQQPEISPTSIQIATTDFPMSPLRLQLEMICPSSQPSSLLELGLDHSLNLVVMRYDEELIESGVYTISALEPAEMLVPNSVPPEGWIYIGFTPIFKGEWLRSYRYSEESSERHLYLSSLNGAVDRQIASLSQQAGGWLLDNQTVVIDKPSDYYGDWRDRMPIRTINLNSLKGENLFPLPKGGIFDSVFIVEGSLYALFYRGLAPFEDIALFSYVQGISIPVYSWLTSKEGINYNSTTFSIDEGDFSLFVSRDYGFDFAKGLSLKNVQLNAEYDQIMQSVLLPEDPQYDLESTFLIASLDEDKYLIGRRGKNLDISIFLVNLESNTLLDFCLTLPRASYFVSPNSKYLAITTFEEPSNEIPLFFAKDTMVIDLQTGARVSLGRTKAIGWAIAPN